MDNKKEMASPKTDKVTKAQEIFINEIIKGNSQRRAFLKAYPKKASWKWNSIDTAASVLFKMDKVAKRYNEIMSQIRADEVSKAKWTREMAIETLRDIIIKNQKEYERIQETLNKEVEILLDKIKKNPHKAGTYTRELHQKLRARVVTATHNTGVIAAVAELNKMQGFNEENINLSASVVFSEEDLLED